MKPHPIAPGQESVWSYPRPPRLEPVTKRLRVELGGTSIAETTRGYRVLETSHPPVYYFPPDDIIDGVLVRSEGGSFCEWKGQAVYWAARAGDRKVELVGWSYPNPTTRFAAITDHVAFYAGRVDACYVDDERVTPQPGDFYGGWITSDIVGPFKGEPGTMGW